jgi:hypothetical protein
VSPGRRRAVSGESATANGSHSGGHGGPPYRDLVKEAVRQLLFPPLAGGDKGEGNLRLSDETGQGPALGNVIPAQAGIQSFLVLLDSRLRGSDDRDALASAGLTKDASCRTASKGGFWTLLWRSARVAMPITGSLGAGGSWIHRGPRFGRDRNRSRRIRSGPSHSPH